MYTYRVVHHKKFFRNINYNKLINEISIHEKKLQKNDLYFESGVALDLIEQKHKELNKILKQPHDSNKIANHFKSKFIINFCSAISDKKS